MYSYFNFKLNIKPFIFFLSVSNYSLKIFFNLSAFQRRGNGTHSDSHIHPMDDFDDYYDDYEDHEDHRPHHRPPKIGPPKRKRPKPHKPPKRKHKHKPKPKPPPDDDYKDFFEDSLARKLEQQSLLSRTKFYHILSQRFQQYV